MPPAGKILVVIPAYNEEESLPGVLNEVRGLGLDLDILVVDDGSRDRTSEIARAAGVRVARLPFNQGYGAAVQTGMMAAYEDGYAICVLLDADGQHDLRFIPQLVAALADGKADLALGSRFLGTADYSIPLARRAGMSVFSRITSKITGQKITDPTSGFQAIGRGCLKFFITDNYPADFPDADTLIRLHFAGFRIQEIPVVIRPRLKGVSMHSGLKTLYYIYKMFFSIFIALLQKDSLKKEGSHALEHQNRDRGGELDRADRHHQPGPKKKIG